MVQVTTEAAPEPKPESEASKKVEPFDELGSSMIERLQRMKEWQGGGGEEPPGGGDPEKEEEMLGGEFSKGKFSTLRCKHCNFSTLQYKVKLSLITRYLLHRLIE